MNREIKFRGRRIDNRQWVYGQYFVAPLTDENSGTTLDAGWYFLSGEQRHCIVQDGVSFVIDEKTVSEYTGLKDKNGTEIYEGDIIESKNALGVVKWHTSWASFYMSVVYGRNEYGEMVRMISARPMYNDWNSVEIIGNIYENADLLDNTVSEHKPTQSTSV